ncbi:RHS repeat-associated core domain-containing protein [Pseudoduganella violacea]|uniref:RHS repeat-associated protein n=1 Tax=Pseudoduganella violacea TaxID=1715466 RepID=A0A7W5FWL5_9BURK|nr:RHS repeat-associated core domain-containing protein [Pseudoduganella violacea]MBB3121403.1 RHS repeat-associated protein [Pseudoduganella violacea]
MSERHVMSRHLRWLPALLLPVLLAAPAGAQNPAADAPRPGLQKLAAPAPLARPGQSVTQLPDGRWLLLGGQGVDQEAVAGIELLDAASGKKEKLPGALLQARRGHSATLLPDGSVLVLGGVDSNGNVVAAAEQLDPAQGRSQALPPLPLIARSGHSATVLTDGRLLIAGGADARGRLVYEAEIYDPLTHQVERFNPKLESARLHHLAALLPTAEVLLWSGSDGEKRSVDSGELYDPGSQRFSSVSAAGLDELAAQLAAPAPLALAGSRPEAESNAAPVDQPFVLRFNQAMDVRSLNGASVTLLGPHGTVPLKVVPVEQGLLAFIKPAADLLPDSRYTLFVDGARSRSGVPLGFTSLGFSTARLTAPAGANAAAGGRDAAPVSLPPASGINQDASRTGNGAGGSGSGAAADAALQPGGARQYGALEKQAMAAADSVMQSEVWQPDATALKGDWRAKRGESPLQKLPPLQAPPGETALAGQVLTMHGRGLRNVRLQIGEQTVLSDDTGRFLLRGIPAGVQVLSIDGFAADKEATRYGYYQVRVDVHAGKTTALDYTIWSSRLDPAGNVAIASPNDKEVVLTSPRIPGLELRIPAGSVIRDRSGKIVTELNMTAIPVDRPPFPLPNVGVPVYFTVQPGGASITSTNTRSQQGARLVYPNFSGAAPGSRVDFWNYDARGKGWYVYGQGTISPDGKQAIPDADVKIYEFTGAMISVPSNGPPEGPPPGGCGGGGSGDCNSDGNQPAQPSGCAGDPVDCATGLFLNNATDLAVDDVIPMRVTRSYRPRDPASRGFGVGTNLQYDYFLVGDTSPWTYQELILPDGGRLRYKRISAGTGYTDAVYLHTASTTRYYGSVLRHKGGSCYWELKLKDGEAICFPESMNSTVARAAAATSLSDRYGNTLTFTRTSNNLTRIASPSGRYIDFVYDAKNRITQASDNAGRTVGYEYDAAGRLAKVTDPLGNTELFTYDAAHNMLTVQDKRGNLMVTNVYDANNRVSKQTYADGSTNLFSYTLNAASKVTQTDVTNERGIVKRIEFNAAGYPLRITTALGLPEQQIEVYERDPLSNLLLARTDALGRKTAYTYDEKGNLLTQTLFAGSAAAVTSTMTYSGDFSQLLSQTDGAGRSNSWTYDSRGNVTEVKDANGITTRTSYNSAGQAVEFSNGEGKATSLAYDGYDLASVTDPLGRAIASATDTLGRRLNVSDALGNRIVFEQDALGRVTRITNALEQSTNMGFDGNGNSTSLRDAKLNQHQFGFSKVNTLTSATDPLNRNEILEYDPAHNLSKFTDRKGQVSSFTYDGQNRMKTASFADGSSIAYTYDAGDRLTRIADSANGVITRSYDSYDNLLEEVTPKGRISYAYDAYGRRTSATVAGQPTISYSYDAGGRLTRIEQAAGASNNNAVQRVDFEYDRNNARTKVTYPNGVVRANTYDDAGQLTLVRYTKADGSLLGDLTFSYDLAGRRTASGGSLARTLLPDEVSEASVDAANRLTSFNGHALSYDANGNLLSDGTQSYVWNARDQLVQIKALDGSVIASFGYDALGRRQSKTVAGVGSGYLYDGLNVVQELNGVNADGSIPANVRANYILGGVDEVFAQTSGSGASARVTSYLSDAIGSVIRLTDGQGNKVVDYQYGPYGQTQADAAHGNPFQYTGRENDGTGLYYYRARYYSPATGRFIQSDPIGLGGGVNTYAYVYGNPISKVDPSGEFGIVGGLIGAGFELGIQAYKNYRDGCDIFDIDNYDWWDVGVSAAVGALAPGMMNVGKTAWKSGNAIRALSSQSANTANRAAKIAGRISQHKNSIRDITATQAAYQGAKAAAKAANGDGGESCGCQR